jgi:hypothetical protein
MARLVERAATDEDWVELPAGSSPLDSRVGQWWVRRIPDPDSEVAEGAWVRWIIVRRRPEQPDERDYFLAWGPEETPVKGKWGSATAASTSSVTWAFSVTPPKS